MYPSRFTNAPASRYQNDSGRPALVPAHHCDSRLPDRSGVTSMTSKR